MQIEQNLEVAEALEAPEAPEAPELHFDQMLGRIMAQLFGVPHEAIEPWEELCELVQFDGAVKEVGLGGALRPGVRIALGAGLLFLGTLITRKRYGDRYRRDVREREELVPEQNGRGRPQPSPDRGGPAGGSQFDALLERTMADTRAADREMPGRPEGKGGVRPEPVTPAGGSEDIGRRDESGDGGGRGSYSD